MSKSAAAICVGVVAGIVMTAFHEELFGENEHDEWEESPWPDWDDEFQGEDQDDREASNEVFKSLRGGSSRKDQYEVTNLKMAKDIERFDDNVALELTPFKEQYWRAEMGPSGTGYQWIYNQESCKNLDIQIETISMTPVKSASQRNPMGAKERKFALFTLMPRSVEDDCEVQLAYAQPWNFDWDSSDSAFDIVEVDVFWEGQVPMKTKEALMRLDLAYDLDELEDDYNFELNPYEPYHMRAVSNPSTGYNWIVDYDACPDLGIQMEDVRNSDGNLRGSPTNTLFTFTPRSDKGKCMARLAYARSWEFNWEKNVNKAVDMIELDLTWRAEPERPRVATNDEVSILEDFAYDLDNHRSNDIIELVSELNYWKAVSNPTTGYKWMVDPSSCAQLSIDMENLAMPSQPQDEDGRPPLIGAPSMTLFTVEKLVEGSGSCTVRMANARPFEFDWDLDQSDSAVQIMELDVNWV